MRYLFLLFIPFITFSQTMYVNTDNLILRDFPEKNYSVVFILHAHAKVNISHVEMYYEDKPQINKVFSQITFEYTDSTSKRLSSVSGWVEKKYLTPTKETITVKPNTKHYTDVNLISYVGEASSSPNRFNRYNFPYPLYKGGDTSIKRAINVKDFRKYFKSPTGICYYIDSDGKMVLVDKKHCY